MRSKSQQLLWTDDTAQRGSGEQQSAAARQVDIDEGVAQLKARSKEVGFRNAVAH